MGPNAADTQFVAHSEILIDPEGAITLEDAFRDRLGEVDSWPGFHRLEVWRDEGTPGRYVMVSWWTDRETFKEYMRSDVHRESHARIPHEPARPRGVSFTRYTVIAV